MRFSTFEALVAEQTPRMYRTALRIVGNHSDAEDVLQDAWLAAWRALPGFRGEAAPSTWLYRVVTNTALAQLRRRKPTVELDEGALSSDPEYAASTGWEQARWQSDPERALLRSEQVTAVQQALQRLSPSHRIPLVLREFENLPAEEVADVLQISVSAVYSRLHRARLAMLRELRAQDGDQ